MVQTGKLWTLATMRKQHCKPSTAIELHPTSPTYHSLRGDLPSKMGVDSLKQQRSSRHSEWTVLWQCTFVHILRRSISFVSVPWWMLMENKPSRLPKNVWKDLVQGFNLGIQVALASIGFGSGRLRPSNLYCRLPWKSETTATRTSVKPIVDPKSDLSM